MKAQTANRIAEYMAPINAAGRTGILSSELALAMQTTTDRANEWLKRLTDDGLIGWWPDPVGITINRRRYWANEFRPDVQPAPSGVPATSKGKPSEPPKIKQYRRADGVLVTVAAGWTHDARYQEAPGVQPYGAGFAAAGMGRDVTTGRGW